MRSTPVTRRRQKLLSTLIIPCNRILSLTSTVLREYMKDEGGEGHHQGPRPGRAHEIQGQGRLPALRSSDHNCAFKMGANTNNLYHQNNKQRGRNEGEYFCWFEVPKGGAYLAKPDSQLSPQALRSQKKVPRKFVTMALSTTTMLII